MDDELLSQHEVAKILKVTVGTLANYRCDGTGPRFIKGGRIQYRKRDVLAYLESRVRCSTSQTEAA